jgi:hypothetical protein
MRSQIFPRSFLEQCAFCLKRELLVDDETDAIQVRSKEDRLGLERVVADTLAWIDGRPDATTPEYATRKADLMRFCDAFDTSPDCLCCSFSDEDEGGLVHYFERQPRQVSVSPIPPHSEL